MHVFVVRGLAPKELQVGETPLVPFEGDRTLGIARGVSCAFKPSGEGP